MLGNSVVDSINLHVASSMFHDNGFSVYRVAKEAGVRQEAVSRWRNSCNSGNLSSDMKIFEAFCKLCPREAYRILYNAASQVLALYGESSVKE